MKKYMILIGIFLVLSTVLIQAQQSTQSRLGCDGDWSEKEYGEKKLIFTPENRTVAFNITLADDVNGTGRGFTFVTIVWKNTTSDQSYLNYTAVLLLNESTPVLENPEDYGIVDDGRYYRKSSSIVLMDPSSDSGGVDIEFPFADNRDDYYPINASEEYSPLAFNGTVEERGRIWAIDNPYTVKIVLYYLAEKFPSPTYGFFLLGRLRTQLCAGGFPTLPYEEKTPLSLIVAPMAIAILTIWKKWKD